MANLQRQNAFRLWKVCERKQKYDSAVQAQARIDKGVNWRDKKHLNVYYCIHCGKFHIGHRRKS